MLKLYSTGQIARQLGKCREIVNYYIKRGAIKPVAIVNNRALFTEEEVNRFLAEKKIAPNSKVA